jgi:lactate dehydrogenase-like 2-hydroxyacid dehydrogenase
MLWEPKPDITLYELAEALGVLLPAIGGATSETVKDAVNSLSPNVRRHFRDEETE